MAQTYFCIPYNYKSSNFSFTRYCDRIFVETLAGHVCCTCTLSMYVYITAWKRRGKKDSGRPFFVTLHSANHTWKPCSNNMVSQRDKSWPKHFWKASALFLSGRFKEIFLQDTSSTTVLFYINEKFKFMWLRLIWHDPFLYSICN